MTSVELAREWLKLRQRVEELEAHWKDFMRWDESAIMYDWKGRAEAAETKLARVVEALNYGLLLTASWSDVRTHNWRNGVRAALAAAKGE